MAQCFCGAPFAVVLLTGIACPNPDCEFGWYSEKQAQSLSEWEDMCLDAYLHDRYFMNQNED